MRDVVAHEYFHNYTGNRVTCRDWFQLSLKEGLTVFREHQFALDHGSPGVTRIEQVRTIRELQFPEDAGPRAHPVRPESYVEMNNFYTITVYEKGAEVIRMMAQMAGREAFIRGVCRYLTTYDGQAVTIEDFVVEIERETGLDLADFRAWYGYAGTPRLKLCTRFEDNALIIEAAQATPATPDQRDKPDFVIPVAVQLFADDGAALSEPEIRRLDSARAEWRFAGLAAEPTVSALRGFTAPVRLEFDQSEAALARLMAFDTDPVARWDAGQALMLGALTAAVRARLNDDDPPPLGAPLQRAIGELLAAPPADRALLAEMLTLPSETRIGNEFDAVEPIAVARARGHVKQTLAAAFADRLQTLLAAHAPTGAYRFNVESAGRRRVFALALDVLAAIDAPGLRATALAVYQNADNMSDRMAALAALADLPGVERETALADFAARFAAYPLVMDKWRGLQAATQRPDSVEQVREMLADPAFDAATPTACARCWGRSCAATARDSTAPTAPAMRWSPTKCCAWTASIPSSPRPWPPCSRPGGATPSRMPPACAQPWRAWARRRCRPTRVRSWPAAWAVTRERGSGFIAVLCGVASSGNRPAVVKPSRRCNISCIALSACFNEQQAQDKQDDVAQAHIGGGRRSADPGHDPLCHGAGGF